MTQYQQQASLPPERLERPDSSFILGQQGQGNEYIFQQGEKTAVEHYEESLAEQIENEVQTKQQKLFKRYLCCICFPCLPMWARYGCCILLVLLVTFLIILGILAAIFKIPEVSFNGPTEHPEGYAPFQRANDSLAFNVNFGLKIGVVNDNLESITFEAIKAIAYYPTAPNIAVGGGEIQNVHIKSYDITNFTFPFSLQYNPVIDDGFAMLSDIAKKCGLLGDSLKEDIYVEYDLIPTIRIAGIAISPVLRQSSRFPCPISEGQLDMSIEDTFDEEDEEDKEDED